MTEHIVKPTSIDCFLRARRKAKCWVRVVSFNPCNSVRRYVFIPHFTHKERLHPPLPKRMHGHITAKVVTVTFRTSPSPDRWTKSTRKSPLPRQPCARPLSPSVFCNPRLPPSPGR